MKRKYPNARLCRFAFIGLFFVLPFQIFAQASQKITTWLDEELKTVASEKKAVLVEERWKENGQWVAKTFYADTRTLHSEYGYADSSRNFKQGIYTEYARNRKKTAQVTYINGKLNGPYTVWLPDGTLYLKGMANEDMIIYGDVEQYEVTGKLKSKYSTDRNGNGTGIEYMVNTGIIGEGPVKKSRQHGTWVYKDNAGKKVMEVIYNDSGTIASETCFDADGKIKTGECISDRRPAFKGGPDGWRKFLEKNLKYPKEARRAQVQGVVTLKFLVKADGSVANIKVIDSPDPLLAEEAVRIVSISPNWEPGIECNKTIAYTHVQRITFRLE